jgi:hypothetical protein
VICANCSGISEVAEEGSPVVVGPPATFTKMAGSVVYVVCGGCAQAADVAVPEPPARPIPARWRGGQVL